MPKMKASTRAKKRIKVTGTGRLRRNKAFHNHLMETKSSTRARRLGREADVSPTHAKTIKRMLGL
jgi:large subunit ribosomal protein L35